MTVEDRVLVLRRGPYLDVFQRNALERHAEASDVEVMDYRPEKDQRENSYGNIEPVREIEGFEIRSLKNRIAIVEHMPESEQSGKNVE